jgi:hypothetical protein
VIRADVKVGDLSTLIAAARDAPKESVERAAFVAKKVITRTLITDVGADQRLSGTASNAKVGVNYQLARTGAAQAVVKATGPWPLFNNTTTPHLILAQALGTRSTARRVQGRLGATVAFGGSGRRMFQGSTREYVGSRRAIEEGRARVAKKAITTPAGLRAYAFHPGTAGKRTWQRGVEASKNPVALELRTAAVGLLAEGMKGV